MFADAGIFRRRIANCEFLPKRVTLSSRRECLDAAHVDLRDTVSRRFYNVISGE